MEEMNDLRYSEQALFNRAELCNGLNDVNLFVEDADSEYIYETIFKRMLGEDYHLTPFACGGKTAVIKMFNERGHFSQGTKNVYLVDGDFDRFLRPTEMINDPQFVYLKKYNIESCIINERGLCSIVKRDLKCIDKEAKRRLDFSNWKNRIVNESFDLFIYYCFVQKEKLNLKNVDRSHYLFLNDKTGFKKADDVLGAYLAEIKELDCDAEQKIKDLKKDYKNLFGDDREVIICGKFLLTSLSCYLKKITKRFVKETDLFWEMAQTYDPSQLDYVKDVLLSV